MTIIQGFFDGCGMSFPLNVSTEQMYSLLEEGGSITELDTPNQDSYKELVEMKNIIELGNDAGFSGINQIEFAVKYIGKPINKTQTTLFMMTWFIHLHKLLKQGKIQNDEDNGLIILNADNNLPTNKIIEMVNAEREKRARSWLKKAKNDKKRKAKKAKKTAGRTEQGLQEDETRTMGDEDINQAVKHLECMELFAIAHPCDDYDCDVSLNIMEHITVEAVVVEIEGDILYL